MRILIVDDSPVIRKIIRKELAAGSYEIAECVDGASALESYASFHPDLITLDVDMPGMSGFDVCEQIRAIESDDRVRTGTSGHVPVVFITVSDTVAGRERGFRVGATDFLTKPFPPSRLLETARNILQPRPMWSGATALVAEDSALIRSILHSALQRLGVHVLVATDGAAALELAREHHQVIDIIVSDFLMPHMNGDELCRELRRLDSLASVPILVLSAKSEESTVLKLFAAGATDYVTKPFSMEELMARVQAHLHNRILTRNLSEQRDAMQEDLLLAREVQQATLKRQAPPDFVTTSIAYYPFGQVSGDIYDFATKRDGDLRTLVGDATGHGVGAAFMTMMIQTGLDSIGHESPIDETMTRLHKLIYERSGERFFTATYAQLTARGELSIVCAGHPPLIVLRHGSAPVVFKASGGLPLGMLEEPLPFDIASIELSPGDAFFAYTDGITELERPDKEQYGIERMLGVLGNNHGDSISDKVDAVLADAKEFSRGNPYNDDLTIIGIQYR